MHSTMFYGCNSLLCHQRAEMSVTTDPHNRSMTNTALNILIIDYFNKGINLFLICSFFVFVFVQFILSMHVRRAQSVWLFWDYLWSCDIFQCLSDVARENFQGADVGVARENSDSDMLKRWRLGGLLPGLTSWKTPQCWSRAILVLELILVFILFRVNNQPHCSYSKSCSTQHFLIQFVIVLVFVRLICSL